MIDKEKIDFAFVYATEKHSKQFRKQTKIPYIVHIYEVYQYLREEGADQTTLIGGILHDIIEDTGTTAEEITNNFGDEVAKIVESESEDKRLPYLERKTLHMQRLSKCDERTKLINCADKLSNLRSIYLDLCYFKDDVWNKFNGSKDEIKKYYGMALEALKSISDREIYKKLKKYYDLTF